MSLAVRLVPETVKTLAFGSIGAAYSAIGSSFSRPIRMIVIYNLTDTQLMFSFNGVDDHLPLPINGYIVLDISANKTQDSGWFIAQDTQIYVKEIATPASSGSVYISSFYGATTL